MKLIIFTLLLITGPLLLLGCVTNREKGFVSDNKVIIPAREGVIIVVDGINRDCVFKVDGGKVFMHCKFKNPPYEASVLVPSKYVNLHYIMKLEDVNTLIASLKKEHKIIKEGGTGVFDK